MHVLCINHLEFTVTAIEVPTKTRAEDVCYLIGVNLTQHLQWCKHSTLYKNNVLVHLIFNSVVHVHLPGVYINYIQIYTLITSLL